MTKRNIQSIDLPSSVVTGTSSGTSTWAANTAYNVNQIVIYRGNTWVCNTAHTSGTTFATTNWTQIGDVPQMLFSPKQFGAIGDAKRFSTGTTTSGAGKIVDTTTAPFTSADVGKLVAVQYGSSIVVSGVYCTAYAVISAYVSASQVTLDRGIPRGLTNATYVYGTNDATAIQAAATAAQAYFTANGLSAAVSLDGHFITNIAITSGINVSWVGYGWGASGIHFVGYAANPLITCSGSSTTLITNCVFKDFEIDCMGMNNTGFSLTLKGLSAAWNYRCLFANLWVHDAVGTGLAFDQPYNAVCYGCLLEGNGRLDDANDTDSNGYGGNGIGNAAGGQAEESAIISDCVARNNRKCGIYWETGLASTSEYIISNCLAVGNRDGFAENAGGGTTSRTMFANCRSRGNARFGYALNSSIGGAYAGRETSFEGCLADGNAAGGVFYNGYQALSTDGKFSWRGGRAAQNGTLITLSTALTTSAAITALPVNALTVPLASASVVTTMSGGQSQQWTLSTMASVGSTSIAVSSQTPSYAFPVNTIVTTYGFFGHGIGLQVGQANLQGFSVRDADIYQNTSSGILMTQGSGSTGALTDLDLRDNNVWGNSTFDPANISGIKIANTTTNYCQITDNHCWDPLASGSKTQLTGLELATGSSITNLNAQGNDLRGNQTNALLQNATLTSAVIKNNPGYNPLGLLIVTVPSSGSATAVAPVDQTFYVTAGASSVAIAISNGPAVTIPTNSLGTLRCPAGQTLTPTYSVAPTWVVEGE
jgi:hypothetical protein